MKAFFRFGRSRQKAKKTIADTVGTSSAEATTSREPSSREFEVFLNFRGPDSRFTVVNVLYDALDRAGIRVFYDDENIRPGAVIEGELKEAILNSKIYIPIFSKNYASSKWCLRELDLIMRCWQVSLGEEKTILPIFYDVDVSTDLKLKSEVYTTDLQKHKDLVGEDVVKRWENALWRAATIKGWDLLNHGLAELTKLIVEEVCRMLWTRSDVEKVPDDYLGIDYPMEEIIKLLDLDAHDVRFVTIHGMGGMGKTTLARLVFNKISSSFGQRVAFLSNVREKSHRDADVVHLQRDLISQLLQVNSSLFLRDTDHGVKMIKGRLKNKKVLIALDDLDKSDQLLKLANETSWFGMGSRIIITTRNIGIMPKREGFYQYRMQEMKRNDALKLFSKRVFNSDSPPEGYDEISSEVVDITKGLPLAISVIAPLFRNSSIDAWEGPLSKLKQVVHKDVREKLMISYEQLDKCEKEIFLDIACLLINKEIEDATFYWEARRLYPSTGIMVLKNMSLIEIVDGNKLGMHDLLRDLGRNLVDEETNIYGRRSRLWSPEVALKTVHRKKGTEEVVALKLGKLHADCTFNLEQFAGLTNLEFLELDGGHFANEDFKEAFSELRWLSWDDCPPEFRATNLCFENLILLMLSENLITNDWGGWGELKAANNLKVLKCTYCRFLTMTPDFSAFPKLERLVFKNCATLREIDPSIVKLEHLTYLEITNPFIYMERLPDEYISYQLEEGGPQILPDSIGRIKSLSVLKLKFVNLSKLPASIGYLVNLKHLCLWCPKLKELPETIKNLKSLVELDISFTAITKMPSIRYLWSLKVVKYENCQLEEEYTDLIERKMSRHQLRPGDMEKLIPSYLLKPARTERIEILKNK